MVDEVTDEVRRVVDKARSEAGHLRHGSVGTEHLLLGLLTDDGGSAGIALRHAGASFAAARHKVAEAVPAGTASTEVLPLTARAERALERAARFARREQGAPAGPEHVLLGVLDVEGLGCQVLRGLGVDVGHLRAELLAARDPSPSAADDTSPAEVAPVRCPACLEPLDDPVPARELDVRLPGGDERSVVVAHCGSCGVALGVVPR